ncbi:hypothetical protein [Rhodopirellula sp. SWK7]|uniref:tetratricopeptide repeat protein n=1 Tax=Rhodopirellula sp. SWK7 TaxID=595460 RepID=UPI0005C7746C|nr:hypothetical protein [Rhodopirellula sp. SWK7]
MNSPESSKYRDLLLSLPSVVVFCTVMGMVLVGFFSTSSVEAKYRAGAQKAFKDNEYGRAKVFYARVLDDDPMANPRDWLSYADVLAATGEEPRAKSILDQLAPDEKPGYGPAHERKATNIAAKLGESKDPDKLSKLLHHLTYGNDDRSIACLKAWSTYYMAVNEPTKALDKMDMVAKIDPNYLPVVAHMFGQQGDEAQKWKLAEKSVQHLSLELERDPMNHQNRIRLAQMMLVIDREDDAGTTLLEGLAIKDDATIRTALAAYSVHRFAKEVERNGKFTRKLNFLAKALQFDPKYAPAYTQMVFLFRRNRDDSERKEVKRRLLEMVTSGQGAALAHFALSDLYGIERNAEQMQWHAEKAYSMDPGLTVVANNLAWLLAHAEDPDLDRAMELARDVVKTAPNQPEYLDTLGTVLMKRGEYDDAIDVLERALPAISSKKNVHEKLAFLYEKIGQDTIADMHNQQARGIATAPRIQ